MPRNPLRDENQLPETTKGEDVVNIRSQKIVRIKYQNGNIQESVTSVHNSAPDQNGVYVDTELTNVTTDHAGNPLPKDPSLMHISHSGLYIVSPEQLSHCTSFFHSNNRSRIIFIGQDGRLVPGGAICSSCDFWLNTIYIVLGILGIGAAYGLYKAVEFF